MASSQSVDQGSLTDLLSQLGDPLEESFDFGVRDLIDTYGPTVPDLEQLFDDPQVGFAAFSAALALSWRDQDFQLFRELVRDQRVRFRHEPVFASYDAQATLGTMDVDELRCGVKASRGAIQALPTRPSVLHTFAVLVVELAELGSATTDELRDAEAALRIASREKPDYAKYYATRARVLSFLGNYPEAHRNVATAIELEPSSGRHYPLRIGEYQGIRMNIVFRENSDKISARVTESVRAFDRLQADMAATRTQLMEILGLLAAVIAFVVTGAQISVQVSATEAVPMMGAVGAAIVLAFSSLSLLYGSLERRKAAMLLMALSVAFLAVMWGMARWAL